MQVPASVGQRLLAMIAHYRRGHGALSCPVLCQIRGPLRVDALQQALDGLTAAHESLRTTMTGRGTSIAQVVHDPATVELRVVDAAQGASVFAEDAAGAKAAANDAAGAYVDTAVAAELTDPVEVTAWPLRATLWRTGPLEHTLCLNIHHLFTDAWSTGILFTDLLARYAQARGEPVTPAMPQWQYRDFVAWQEELSAGNGLDRHREYWRQRLAALQLPNLPYQEPGPADEFGVHRAEIPPHVADGLRQVAKTCQTTLFTLMLALYYAVLRRTCGQDDLAVASLFANRSRPEAGRTVGFLANMVVLRTEVSGRASFAEAVRATHATVAGALAHQEHPYQTLPLEAAALGHGRADDVVFQMMAEFDHRAVSAGVEFELLVPDGIGARFGTELALAPRGRGITAVLFTTPRLSPQTAKSMLAAYLSSAAAVAGNPTVALKHLGR
ncbi:MAG TPA: condensation domain-containing protein [Streptosporangiaceae bacterium]|nr:condensation domain-containing protein [Streptosporangiaceae bacterium]